MPRRLTDNRTWGEVAELFYHRQADVIGNKAKFIKWFMKQEIKSGGKLFFGVDTYVYCYKVWRKLKKKKEDHFTVIVGKEGSGKSTLAAQLSVTISDTFTKGSILFEPDNYLLKIEQSSPGDGVVADEGALFLFSRNAMKGENVDIVMTMQLMRQQYTHTVICIPRWRDLDTYVREHRADTLFYIRKSGDFRVVLGSGEGIAIINEVYPKRVKKFTSIKIPYQYVFDDYNNDLFPEYNGLTKAWYVKAKKENYLKRSKKVRQKIVRNSLLTEKNQPYEGMESEAL
jgi:energy-coupling factor transporter ATP-binding protein EcfA2